MLSIAATTSPTAYWYLARGTGTVTLLLLTVSVALGVANVRRVRTVRMPRFVLDAVHRNASLLAMAFLLVHILTSLLDGYAPIRLVDVIIPFVSAYRPLWLGFGALAFDLLAAIVVTSVLRRRFGYRTWRIVHWAAYASWPVALLHGLGTGSDTKTGWMLMVVAGSVIVVIVAIVARATADWGNHLKGRFAALAGSALVPLGLLVWLPSGPLAAGWAQKAGTPASLLRAVRGTSGSSASSSPSTAAGGATRTRVSFTAQATGSVRQGSAAGGLSQVDISLSLTGQRLNALAITLVGEALDDGGLQMTSSRVTLGPASDPRRYQGAVTSLEGTNITAQLRDRSGHRLTVTARLALNSDGGSASGTVSVTP